MTEELDQGDNRPSAYWETIDGREVLIIRASAFGGCMWELVAAAQGHEPTFLPTFLDKAFKAGKDWEPRVLSMMEEGVVGFVRGGLALESAALKWKFMPGAAQKEGELKIVDGRGEPVVIIRYHPDNIGYHEPQLSPIGHCVVEVKALSGALWERAAKYGVGDVIKEYPWQLSIMMHGEGQPLMLDPMPGVWVAYNKDEESEHGGMLLYDFIDKPPYWYGQIVQRARMIYDLATGEDILESGRECDEPDHFPCRYQHLRPEVEKDEIEEETVTQEDVIETLTAHHGDINYLMRQYVQAKGQVDESQVRKNDARDKLLAAMKAQGKDVAELITDRGKARKIKGRGKSSYDWKSMPAELKAELEKYRQQGKEYDYVQVELWEE